MLTILLGVNPLDAVVVLLAAGTRGAMVAARHFRRTTPASVSRR
jgi:hypothetical protein